MALKIRIVEVVRVIRGGEWWSHKLASILCGFLLTDSFLREGNASHGLALLVLLLSLVPGAAYVSIVNDITDIEADSAAGKPNRMAARSPAFRAAAVALSLAGGALFFWLWRGHPGLLACYAAAWVAFTLYCVPPVRLKQRGVAGIVADGAGAQLFPTLTAALAAFAAAGRTPDALWLAAMALWSLAYGVRSNLAHQLADRDLDRASGVATFAARRSAQSATRLGTHAAFPIELAAFAALLAMAAAALPLLALAAYALLALRRARLWKVDLVVAAPTASYRIALHEYYDIFLPLALLAASALRHPADLLLVPAYMALFPVRLVQTTLDGWRLIGRPLLQRLGLIGPPRPASAALDTRRAAP